jgi:ankyrin repeat protein
MSAAERLEMTGVQFSRHDPNSDAKAGAAFYDSTECLLLLLDAGLAPDSKSANDLHPLHFAVGASIECAAVLLSRGADPSYAPAHSAFSPLFLAARSGSVLIIHMLFDKGARLEPPVLREALRCRRRGCFDALIARDCRGIPLLEAVRAQLVDAIPVLLARGADINAADSQGHCPLYIACVTRNVEIVRMLCEDGTIRYDVSGPGQSAPIHWAAQSCLPDIVQMVIDGGADVKARNVAGESAIAFALRFPIHKRDQPELRDRDISDQIRTLKKLVDAGLDVNDRRNVGDDDSLAVVNYLLRPDMIDVRVVEFLFDEGLRPETQTRRGKVRMRLGDYLLEEESISAEIKSYIVQRLQRMEFRPRDT